jgi:hypothetical protein
MRHRSFALLAASAALVAGVALTAALPASAVQPPAAADAAVITDLERDRGERDRRRCT